MIRNRLVAILGEVEKLLRTLSERREELWAGSPPLDFLDLIDPRVIVTKFLGVRYSEPMEIPSSVGHGKIAGFIDREKGEVAVAQNLKSEVRRFTAAHEIGHWILHPGTKYFRDAPTDGGDRDQERPVEEREADLFAAALLMPEDLVRKQFRRHFGVDTLADAPVNEDLASLLSFGTGKEREIKPSTFKTTRDIAKWAARCFSLRTQGSTSLANLFKVSVGAMAIRLEELRLVPELPLAGAAKKGFRKPGNSLRKETPPTADFKEPNEGYHVFISYNRKDEALIKPILAEISAHGLNLWYDGLLPAGCSWDEEIEVAVKNSKTAVIFLGAQGFGGFQVNEVVSFIELGRPVIPVFISGWNESMPFLLKRFQGIDLRKKAPEALERLIRGIAYGAEGKKSH
jgi:IrrE N-terminal-like domain/TIR domain